MTISQKKIYFFDRLMFVKKFDNYLISKKH